MCFSLVALCISVSPDLVSASSGCSYFSSGKKVMAKDKAKVKFKDGLNQCKNGKWVVLGNTKGNQNSDKAVSIACFNYQYRSCEVIWSSGRRTLGSEYGSKSGGIVDSTTYIDLSGRRWCVNLYAGGGIKYAGWC